MDKVSYGSKLLPQNTNTIDQLVAERIGAVWFFGYIKAGLGILLGQDRADRSQPAWRANDELGRLAVLLPDAVGVLGIPGLAHILIHFLLRRSAAVIAVDGRLEVTLHPV